MDLGSSYGRNLLQGISRYVQEVEHWKCETTFTFFGSNAVIGTIEKSNMDGIIFFSPDKNDLSKVLKSGIPAIVKGVDKPVPGFINFYTDNMMVCKKAFDHFRSLGFERFAYCGFDWLYWSKERSQAFEHILMINGYELKLYPIPKKKIQRKWKNEQSILTEWLLDLPKPIALLAANDFRAKEVLEVCKKEGIEVPRQIAILGVDDDDCICPFTTPPLSSIGRIFKKAGYEAAETLNTLMSGRSPERHEIVVEPKEVIARQSTNILAVKHPDVAKALLFIRKNKTKPLSVTMVADHVAVHEHMLSRLFKENIGHTVYHEIKRVRSDEISRLLLETNWTVSEIAHEMGFKDTVNFARYFSQAKGMSPTAYRDYYIPL